MILSHFKSYYLIRLHLVPFYFISVLEVGNGFVEVIATSGDSHLGVCVRERVCERERERVWEWSVWERSVYGREWERAVCVCVYGRATEGESSMFASVASNASLSPQVLHHFLFLISHIFLPHISSPFILFFSQYNIGGDDFDALIVEWLVEQYAVTYNREESKTFMSNPMVRKEHDMRCWEDPVPRFQICATDIVFLHCTAP